MRFAPAIMALALATPAALLADADAGPRAVVPIAVHDFEKVPPRDVLVHEFEIRNEGNAPLEILGVDSTCPCAAARFDAVIAPGTSGKVTAQLDTKRLNGATSAVLAVRTNDPESAPIRFEVRALIEPLVGVRPGYARWSYVHGEEEGTIAQTLWALDGRDFRVLDVQAPESIRVEFRPARDEERREGVTGSQWRVEATLDGDAPVGPVTGFIEVRTDHPLQPVTWVPVSGFVRPVAHVTPPGGDFGEVTLGTGKPALFVFKSFTTVPVALLGVESTVEGVKVAVEPQPDQRTYRVEVTFPAEMTAGAFDGTLRFRTSHEKLPLIEVPLSGTAVKTAGG